MEAQRDPLFEQVAGAAQGEGQGNGQAAEEPAANDPTAQQHRPTTALPTGKNDMMNLTPEELEWAMNIQEMIELEPGLEPLPDFWYAQIALVSKGNLEDAVMRAHGYKAFREEYDIVDTVGQAIHVVREFLEALPGYFLSLSNDPGAPATVVFDCSKFQRGFSLRTWIRGFYYIFQATCTNLKQIREGQNLILNFEGFDWTKNFGMKEFQEVFHAFACWHPHKRRKTVALRCSTMAHVMVSMGLKLMPPEHRQKTEFLPHGPHLATLHCVPNTEAVVERIVANVASGLERRYAHEASFQLSD